MVVNATAFTDTNNGYEQRTDGLWVHKGKADFGTLRANNSFPGQMRSGAGVEILYDRPSTTGTIQAYDRDAGAYRDLNIAARNIGLYPSGTLSLPAGSIGTAAIAPDAVQQYLGGYASNPAWSTTNTAGWTALPATLAINTSGGLLRIEFTGCFYHSVAYGGWYTGIGWDGVARAATTTATSAVANATVPSSWTYYASGVAAGAHTITAYAYNLTAGTLTYNQGAQMYLYVTEQKR